MRLKDKVAIVTGGAVGIGREMSVAMANEGADIVVIDVAGNMDEVSSAVKAAGRKCLTIKADISKRAEIQAAVDKAIAELGKIDILVNNAAIYPFAPFLECTDEIWNKTVEVGLYGTFLCSQIAAREMVKKGYGKIINIASTQGILGIPLTAAYTAVKGAVIALTREMATELSPAGINVNCIAPGLTLTEHAKSAMPPEVMAFMGQAVPIKRLADPKDYNGIIVFLASDDSKYATGATFCVDGGIGSTMLPGLPPG
ncbi:MAG: glucose 1-dehydrogenase [Desulfobacterium sp.]|nr:glucose 1-dehydrogenase [Desulfobacterium sp.]MBU4036565.1 glucose 1-dehydrogenase [Pseudomonadota bacterium]